MSVNLRNVTGVTCPPRRIRLIEDNTTCLLCKRRVLKEEAHWCCTHCRKEKPEAKCREDCSACIVMLDDETRKKALLKADKKRSFIKALGNCTESAFGDEILPNDDNPKNKISKKVPSDNEDPFTKRMKDFEHFLLLRSLDPELPGHLVEKGFVMPTIPERLKLSFSVAKDELFRLMSSASICYHLSHCRQTVADDSLKEILNADVDGINEVYATLLKVKSNDLGRIIFEIREHLLAHMTSKDDNLIPLLLRGPIDPTNVFFGNLNDLEKSVKKSKKNVLCVRK